jgi:hypothetical protein
VLANDRVTALVGQRDDKDRPINPLPRGWNDSGPGRRGASRWAC